MSTLYDLKAKVQTVGAQLKSINDELVAKLADPGVDIGEINALETKKNDLQKRFDLLKDEHDKVEAEQRAKLQFENPMSTTDTDEGKVVAAKAAFIRASIAGASVSQEVLAALQTTGTTTGGGEKFLPTTMSTTLISEPFAKNQLRKIVPVSNIKGLELPKIAYSIDSDDFITDDDTAKELELTGDKVTFGRFKFKVFAGVSDSVIHGSDIELTNWVENALRSGLAAKEKKNMLAASPAAGEGHMSFYTKVEGSYAVKEVSGEDLYEAVTAAIADLHEDYRENATVVMAYADYLKIIKALANGSASLYSAPPESVIGKPVVFCDSATVPIVGDFNYARINYDGPVIYDTDKDVKTGEYLFVITAWADIQLLLKSAFRLATVTPPTP